MLSRKTTTFSPLSTSRFARATVISATRQWLSGVSSKVELMTSASTLRSQSATSSPGRHEVHHPCGHFLGVVLEHQLLVGKYGGELFEEWPPGGGLRIQAVDRHHPHQALVALAALGAAHLPGHFVTGAKPKPPDLGLRDVDVLPAWKPVGIAPQETGSFVPNP